MKKIIKGLAVIGLGLSLVGCQKAEPEVIYIYTAAPEETVLPTASPVLEDTSTLKQLNVLHEKCYEWESEMNNIYEDTFEVTYSGGGLFIIADKNELFESTRESRKILGDDYVKSLMKKFIETEVEIVKTISIDIDYPVSFCIGEWNEDGWTTVLIVTSDDGVTYNEFDEPMKDE